MGDQDGSDQAITMARNHQLGPAAAEYVKVSEMRDILRRLLDKKK
jgi:hypothetical protein